MEVQILSRKLITPSSPTPEHLQTLKLSYLDQLAPAFYVPRIFYFLPNGEEEGLVKNREKSEQLQKSLAETLTLFYPLAGRYIRDKWSIECNDKGAEYLEAEVSGTLSQLLGQGGGKLRSEWLNNLVPDPDESDNTPLLFVQFNTFKCGGVAVGVCLAHRASDGSSVFKFIDSWAKLSRMGAGNLQFCPNFNLGSFFPQKDLPTGPTKKVESEHDELSMKRLVFNAASISNLKKIATTSTNTDQPPLKHQPTRLEVVMGFIWMSFIRTFQTRNGCLRPSLISIPVNMRNKAKLPVPESSWGNFVGRAVPKFLPSDDQRGKVQLPDIVGKVQDAIRSTVSNLAKSSTPEDIVSLVYGALGELVKGMRNPEFDCCFSTSWCRFPTYEVDFGWGKPSWATSVMKPRMRNNIFVLDTKDGDGMEAWHQKFEAMKVEILSRKLISPSSPTPEHLQTLKISRLDQLVGPFYVPRVFYYLPNGEEEGLIKTREKSEQLQKSLAETLTLFYPLAGRYIREKRSIDCNDKGAEYLEAEVSGSLSQLLGQGGGKLRSEWLNNLVPDPEESDNTPLVFVQFNTFTCGGVAIGVCASHRAADGSSVFNFIDSWAKVSRMGHSNLQFSPNFNLGSFFPQEDLLPAPPRKLESGHVELTFKRTFQARHGRLMPSLLTIPVNMRKKTKLQVSESSCGNFVGRAIA
ncbi:hypothetical protein Tsubulata_047627, partial [Turnera subulata]